MSDELEVVAPEVTETSEVQSVTTQEIVPEPESLVIEDCEHKRPEAVETVEDAKAEATEPTEDTKAQPVEEPASIDTEKAVDLAPVVEPAAPMAPAEPVQEPITEPDTEAKEEFHVALDAQGEPRKEVVVYPEPETTPVEAAKEPVSEVETPVETVEEPAKEEPAVVVLEPVDEAISDEPEDIRQWRKDGTHKARVHAFDKIGFHLTTENQKDMSAKQITTWEAAMNEYFAAHPTETT